MKMQEIDKLINNNQVDKAQSELSKLDESFFKDAEYLYLRSKIFYINKLYYLALDALLIATEFEEKDKIYKAIKEVEDKIATLKLSIK